MEVGNLFEEPYEIEAFAHFFKDLVDPNVSDHRPYKVNTLWGYREGIEYLYRICRLFKYETGFLIHAEEKRGTFETIASFLRSSFSSKDLMNNLVQRINDLKKFKFISYKPKLPTGEYSSNMADYREFEITVDQISRWIKSLRQHRIEFYDTILQEYLARKNQYHARLEEFLSGKIKKVDGSKEFPQLSPILEESHIESKKVWDEELIELKMYSWLVRDLLQLKDPTIEKYTRDFNDLTRYSVCSALGSKQVISDFFKIFSIFKNEMNFILTSNLQENFFEKTLIILTRDFIKHFEEKGDLENAIIEYIDELEQTTFFSLEKDQVTELISRIIYRLRQSRIDFYEMALQEYSKNKEKYNKKL
ncbi:MAG: hypothetical protein ACFFCI_20935 [Promethearchaeota archaeon]